MIAFAIASFLFFWSILIAWLMGQRDHYFDVNVSHMNRITCSIIQHNTDTIKEFLAKTEKASFVLPNGCIIVAVRHDNVRSLIMLENVPSDAKRFVSSAEFNELRLTVPGSKGPKVKAFVRHGQAFHNLSEAELQTVWDNMTENKQFMYITRATKRVGTEPWMSLSPERQLVLALQELRYDAPLTDKGCEEARQASEQLQSYLQENYPHAHVRVYASQMLRAYETGALLLATWNTMHTSFSFDTIVHASLPYLNELHREIGSPVHMLGTEGRRVAESLNLHWMEYARHILKNPLTQASIDVMTEEKQQEVKDKIVHITSENVPMPLKQRPISLHGISVCHSPNPALKSHESTFKEYDLFMEC